MRTICVFRSKVNSDFGGRWTLWAYGRNRCSRYRNTHKVKNIKLPSMTEIIHGSYFVQFVMSVWIWSLQPLIAEILVESEILRLRFLHMLLRLEVFQQRLRLSHSGHSLTRWNYYHVSLSPSQVMEGRASQSTSTPWSRDIVCPGQKVHMQRQHSQSASLG